MTTPRRSVLLGLASGLAMMVALPAAAEGFITVTSTTSTENSGLFGHILPIFQKETGIEVRVIAQGTGQALETGRRGDDDVVFLHARAAEAKFVAEGWGVQRHEVTFNDFAIVGPGADPAGVKGSATAAEAMGKIAAAPFASRGDDSGTHAAEKALWTAANVEPAGGWYLSTGAGMGATLNTASQAGAYALTDRGHMGQLQQPRAAGHRDGSRPRAVQPLWHHAGEPGQAPHVKAEAGQTIIDWIVSPAGQAAITGFKVGGEPLFFGSVK